MRAATVVGLVLGGALVVWAIVRPQPTIYVDGVLLVALTAGGTLASARRSRAEQHEGQNPASRRARWAAGGLGTGVAALLVVVLIGIPLLGRWLPAHEGVLWQADLAGGNPAVHAGQLYVGYWPGTGPAGTSVNSFDLADGRVGLDIPGWVFLTEEGGPTTTLWDVQDGIAGDLVLRWSGTAVTAASAADGQQQWQVEVPGTAVRTVVGDGSTVAIISYDDGGGHNPFVPPPEEHSDPRTWPTHVTVLDGATGEIISTTWFADGVAGVAVPAPHQVFVQSGRTSTLVGE